MAKLHCPTAASSCDSFFSMKDTMLRQLMNTCLTVRGRRSTWLPILGQVLNVEFIHSRLLNESYQGNVFKDRIGHVCEDGDREERQVARLYRSCLEASGGVLEMGNECYLLLGYHWPTQGGVKHKSRCADMVAITKEGRLVVFEAKVKSGSYPLIAILEGLDYLSCLLRKSNFEKISKAYENWILKHDNVLNDAFKKVKPNTDIRPLLVVLAPSEYYEKHRRTPRGSEWIELAKYGDSWIPSLETIFAVTDIKSTSIDRVAH